MKRVLILSASARIGGNSDCLCDSFSKGAKDAGHEVEKINICKKEIKYCLGCGVCRGTSQCVIKDDMAEINEKMLVADVIVMATPVYFYNMNGQMKTLIDRTSPIFTKMNNKEVYILMSAAGVNEKIVDNVLTSFEGFYSALENVKFGGVVCGFNMQRLGATKDTKAIQDAYSMGREIK